MEDSCSWFVSSFMTLKSSSLFLSLLFQRRFGTVCAVCAATEPLDVSIRGGGGVFEKGSNVKLTAVVKDDNANSVNGLVRSQFLVIGSTRCFDLLIGKM